MEKYFAEHKPRFHLAILWKWFRDAVGSLQFWPPSPSFTVQDFEQAVSGDWPIGDPAQDPKNVAEWVNRKLRAHYAWADKLADLYADAYRSTYVFIYMAAAFAVFFALLPRAADWTALESPLRAACIVAEFVILGGVIALLWREGKGTWHKRWIAYRLLAELVRQLRCLVPLGRGNPLVRVPAFLKNWGDPAQTWMYWQLRAIARATGIPNCVVTTSYVTGCRDYLNHMVRNEKSGQLGFHEKNATRSKNLSHRLHLAATGLFVLTFVCVLVHLLPVVRPGLKLPDVPERWLILACATLPAFAAAIAGIKNQGEFARIAKRSRSMTDAFTDFAEQIHALEDKARNDSLRLADVTQLAQAITQMMVDEVLDWRVVFTDRPATAA